MKKRWFWAVVVAIVVVAVYVGNVFATPAAGLTTTILAKATVGDLDLTGQATTTNGGTNLRGHQTGLWLASLKTFGDSDLYVVDNKIAPGGSTGWHSHPGPSIIFVVAGTVTNYSTDTPGCAPQVYTAGQSLVDPGGTDEHQLRNEGTTTAETIAVQFLPAAAARRIDEPAPGGSCPS